MEFEKFNCFFVDFLRFSLKNKIKVISTVVEREYTPDIIRQISFIYQLTGFYMILLLYFRKPLLCYKCVRLLF